MEANYRFVTEVQLETAERRRENGFDQIGAEHIHSRSRQSPVPSMYVLPQQLSNQAAGQDCCAYWGRVTSTVSEGSLSFPV